MKRPVFLNRSDSKNWWRWNQWFSHQSNKLYIAVKLIKFEWGWAVKRMSRNNSTMDEEEPEVETNPAPDQMDPDRMAPPGPPDPIPTNMGVASDIHQSLSVPPSPSNGHSITDPGSGGSLHRVQTVDLLGIEVGGHGSGPHDPDISASSHNMPSDDVPPSSDDAAQWIDGMFPHMRPNNPETRLMISRWVCSMISITNLSLRFDRSQVQWNQSLL